MSEKVSTIDVRQRIGDMLNRVALRRDEFVIERKGKALAALVPIERLEQMRRFARRQALDFMEEQKGGALTGGAANTIAGKGLGYVPEDRRVFTDLTVLENLEVGRQAPRRWPDGSAAPVWTSQALFRLFPNLGEMPERLGARMSGGEQQMLTVARTLMGNPLLILLDEPSEGVAPLIVEQMAQMILELKGQGVSILLSEQNLHFAELVSDRAYVLEKGQIRFQASMAELAANDEVRRAYLSL